MTASTGRVFGPKPYSDDDVLPWALPRPLAASVAPFKNWLMGQNSSGYAVAQAAGVTDLVSLGFADHDQALSTTAGAATVLARSQFVSGYANSTGASDAILDTDYAVACWAVDNATVGKKTNLSGVNRSLLGVAFGLDVDNNTPIILPGPIGWLLGRGAHLADQSNGGSYYKAVDAGDATDLAELLVPRPKLHGKVSSVEFVVEGSTLAASGATNYKTLTLSKRDGAGGSPVVVATVDTQTLAFTQWTAVSFTLSVVAGATNLLETDILTIQESHAAAGATIPAGSLRVTLKVG